MKILFLTQTSNRGAASRYRVYQYVEYLQSKGVECQISPGLPERYYNAFYLERNPWRKIAYLLFIIVRRCKDVLRVRTFDLIFIQREIIPQAFPFFEKVIHAFNRNIVFDFDDAIFLVPPQRKSRMYALRDSKAISRIIRLSRLVIAGNDYLKAYALRFNRHVHVLPTAVDTQRWKDEKKEYAHKDKVVLGWIGSMHTLFYLEAVSTALQQVSAQFKICVHLIGVERYAIAGVEVVTVPWDIDTECDQVKKFDIGIAPLFDDAWGKGKCGLKALQYMACGIPVVCSAAGVYHEIIRHGENGFLVSNHKAWLDTLSALIQDPLLRKKIGIAGRRRVEEKYSLRENRYALHEILRSVVQ